MMSLKPKIGDVYQIAGNPHGFYRVVSIGPSPYTKGRYKRVGMKWLGLHSSHETTTTSYFDAKSMKRSGMTKVRRSR